MSKMNTAETTEYPAIATRLGVHYYPAGTTVEELLESAGKTARFVERTAQDGELEQAICCARNGASKALDAMGVRDNEPPETTFMWLPERGPTPTRKEHVFRNDEWNWRAEVMGVRERRYYRDGKTPVSIILSIRLHEPGPEAMPTPRQLTFGFWGTCTTWSNGENKVSAASTWEHIFAIYGSHGAEPGQDAILRDALDSRPGRHYADSLLSEQPTNTEELDAAIRKIGDPRAWWAKMLHPQPAS